MRSGSVPWDSSRHPYHITQPVTSRYFMLDSHVHHDGYALLPRVTGLLAAPGLLLADSRERGHAPGVSGRRARWRACGKCDDSGAQKGQQHGKGQTSSAEAGAPCPILCVVHPPRARRRRHGDLPRQGAGHVPYRVSGPVSRHYVAMGGAVGPTACASNHDACPQPCAGSRPWSRYTASGFPGHATAMEMLIQQTALNMERHDAEGYPGS